VLIRQRDTDLGTHTIDPRMSRRAQSDLGGRSLKGALLTRSQSVTQAERLDYR